LYWINLINDTLDLKSNDYKEFLINNLVISYGIREGLVPTEDKRSIEATKSFQNYKHYKLPITMNPYKYGSHPIVSKELYYLVPVTDLTFASITIKNKGSVAFPQLENHVDIIRTRNIALSYIDKYIDENKFERVIGNNHYIYIKDKDKYNLDLFTVKKPARRIQSVKIDKKRTNKIITMDLETLTLSNGTMKPYLVSWFDGSVSKSYYLSDFNTHEDMLKEAIKALMKTKYTGYKIYLHNFAKFDAIFLVQILNELGYINPILNKGQIITVPLKFSKKEESRIYTITFKDSLQLLLASLRKLAISFGVSTQKGIFPHKFVSEENLNYIGVVPAFEYFDNISLEDYNDYCNNFNSNWSLRDESIKYCKADCISLYEILIKFFELIFEKFKFDANKSPTLPSLAFKLFRTNYLDEEKTFIPMIAGKVANDIRLSYTGGATDMYIPTNQDNELVYGYDVNSLYPTVMAENPMPVGKPTYFEGDIRKYDPEAFGFFYCKITTPEYLEHPILQTHVKTKEGTRTVAALGTYEDMLFSAEMDNAMKYGYNFEILGGYTFKKAYVFKEFINKLYNLRLQYPKDNPMNYISKIIMNSSYGRFGMDDRFTSSLIIDKNLYPKFEEKNLESIIDINSLGDSFLIEMKNDETKTMVDNLYETHNVNVAIASAITAYARIYMSQFKNNPNLKLFYTDTDSIYTNLNPDQMMVLYPNIVSDKGLGLLKLENISSKAIFLAPKLYYLKTIDDKESFKVKGLDKNVKLTEEDFIDLLSKDKTVLKSHDKWFRSIENATISIQNQIYTIQQTDNKRQLIYNANNEFYASTPYLITNDKIISVP